MRDGRARQVAAEVEDLHLELQVRVQRVGEREQLVQEGPQLARLRDLGVEVRVATTSSSGKKKNGTK